MLKGQLLRVTYHQVYEYMQRMLDMSKMKERPRLASRGGGSHRSTRGTQGRREKERERDRGRKREGEKERERERIKKVMSHALFDLDEPRPL